MIYRVSLPIIFTDYYRPWGPNLKADYRKNIYNLWNFSCNSTTSVQFSSVQLLSHVQLFVTPWTAAQQASPSPTPKFTQTHVHWVGDAIQPPHPLSPPSPPALDLFQWVSSSPQVAKVLEFQLQHQPFQWIFRTDFL